MRHGMMNRVRRMLDSRRTATGFGAYLSAVQRRGGEGVPTFDEAQKDFGRMTGWMENYRN